MTILGPGCGGGWEIRATISELKEYTWTLGRADEKAGRPNATANLGLYTVGHQEVGTPEWLSRVDAK